MQRNECKPEKLKDYNYEQKLSLSMPHEGIQGSRGMASHIL